MVTRGVLFGLGLLLLYLGAEALVRGASRLARSLGVSPLIVGLTVVAFGTSAPELVVGVLAAAANEPEVAIGNVVGSNIANIALILGLSAIVCPIAVGSRLLRREIPLLILVSAGAGLLTLDGRIGRLDGILCLLGFGGYLLFVLRSARHAPGELEEEYAAFEGVERPLPGEASAVAADASAPPRPRRPRDAALVVLGLGTLVLGAHLLVGSSVWFARRVGVPELVVGLTIVAVGTSLPELATSVVAAFRRQTEIAVGNIVGSNLFNLLAILGCSALVRPLESPPSLLRFELPAMVAAAVVLLPLAWSRFELERWEGIALLVGYAVFLWVLVGRAAGLG